MAIALAIDVGGTKLAAGVVDDSGRILGRARAPSPTGGAEELYRSVVGRATEALAAAAVTLGEVVGVGVGCAGPMRWPQGVVSPLNMPGWRDFPLRERLAATFHHPAAGILVHNDAVALAAGEHWKGAGAGCRNLLALTVSTGVGGGLVLDGRLYHGKTGNAGHVGHVVVEPDGPKCACGGRGCMEAVASGPNTVRRASTEGWEPPAGVRPDGVALAGSAAAGDPVARRNIERAGRGVGRGLASCANALDLETIVIAGGFSRSGPLFWDALREAFDTHAQFSFSSDTQVVRSQAPDDVGLVGAAAFVLDRGHYGWT
jgi:glucokinase